MIHFSGHGVAVVGRPLRIRFNNSRYVVWDGKTAQQYQPTKWHDCMVMSDMHLVSLQLVRYYLILKGIEPVIIFPCQIGESSIEIKNPEENHVNGLASYCRMKVLTKTITIRDFITETNLLIEKMGFDQIGEVICRKELLEYKMVDTEYKKPICVHLVDMCRVYGNREDYPVDNDIFTP